MNSAKGRGKSFPVVAHTGRKTWRKRKTEAEEEARAAEAEMLLSLETSCPCGGNKNFLKKNKETVGNTFLIKNHIYKNLYS